MKSTSHTLSVARLREEGLDLHLKLDENWFARWQEEDPGLDFAGPGDLTVDLHLERHGHDILVRGHLAGTLKLSCSRCLAPFSQPVEAHFDLLLSPTPEHLAEEEELSRADLDRDFYTGEVVDLDSILREQVLLTLPLKPLCSEACQGICPRCGADLNREPCQCAAEESISPFAKLKNFKP
ncbi:MAG: YceD family protein [Desulfobaccales bacterium]